MECLHRTVGKRPCLPRPTSSCSLSTRSRPARNGGGGGGGSQYPASWQLSDCPAGLPCSLAQAAPTLAALPVDLLRAILQQLLGEAPLEAYPLVKAWQSFALVCKPWMEAARTTPLRYGAGRAGAV